MRNQSFYLRSNWLQKYCKTLRIERKILRNQKFRANKAIGIQDLEDMEMRSYGKELVNEINFVSLHRQPKWLISLW